MTLEHVPDPKALVQAAFRMLEPGGMLALVTHDYTAGLNRLLGRRSPIIDVEHLQLFNHASLRRLVTDAGFDIEHLATIKNQYPLDYWTRLLPLPNGLKAAFLAAMHFFKLSYLPVEIDVGNVLTVGQKPALAGEKLSNQD